MTLFIENHPGYFYPPAFQYMDRQLLSNLSENELCGFCEIFGAYMEGKFGQKWGSFMQVFRFLLERNINHNSESEQKLTAQEIYEWVLAAKADLRVAKMVNSMNLKEQNYHLSALSVYHLQQSVEKATKAFGLDRQMILRSDLKGKDQISHVSPKVFIKRLKEKLLNEPLGIFLNNSKLRSQIEMFSENIEDRVFLNLEGKRIGDYLTNSREISRKFENTLPAVFNRKFRKTWKTISGGVAEAIQKSELIDEKNKPHAVKFVSEIDLPFEWKYLIHTMSFTTGLYYLSIITYAHEAFTRYPGGKITPRDYTENMGIVAKFDEIVEYFEPILNELEIDLDPNK